MESQDRRQAPRAPIRVHMEGRKNGDVFTGTSVNLSETGVLIETGKQLDLGMKVTIRMILPNEEEIVGTGVVVRRENRGLGKFGVAVHWDLDSDRRAHLASIIEKSLSA
jgi:hypothetical protein